MDLEGSARTFGLLTALANRRTPHGATMPHAPRERSIPKEGKYAPVVVACVIQGSRSPDHSRKPPDS